MNEKMRVVSVLLMLQRELFGAIQTGETADETCDKSSFSKSGYSFFPSRKMHLPK